MKNSSKPGSINREDVRLPSRERECQWSAGEHSEETVSEQQETAFGSDPDFYQQANWKRGLKPQRNPLNTQYSEL
jgi:hypothetical protein